MELSTLLTLMRVILAISTVIFAIVMFFLLSSIYTLFKTRIPCVNTPKKNIKKILKKLNLPKGSKFYDLGCSDGHTLFEAEKQGLIATGYELSLYPYLKGLWKKKKLKSSVKIEKKDFLKQNLQDADVVFIYLTSVIFPKLLPKLKKELKPGALVISYSFKIEGWPVHKTINTKPSTTNIYKM